MKDERRLVILMVVAYGTRDMWQLCRIDPDTLCRNTPCPYDWHPFPLSPQPIAESSYYWLIGYYAFQFIWSFIPRSMVTHTRLFFNAACILAACEFAECLINYNDPWGYFIGVPVNITSLRYLFFALFAIPIFSSWKK